MFKFTQNFEGMFAMILYSVPTFHIDIKAKLSLLLVTQF